MTKDTEEKGNWLNSLTFKMIILAILGLFLLIPLEMIKSIIRERQQTSEEIKKEISFQWAGKQTISGPILNLPLLVHPSDKNANPYRTVFHILPESLNVSGDIDTEKRHRSIYEAVVYTANLEITGDFAIPDISFSDPFDVLWNEAYFAMGISDNRGIKGSISLKSADSSIEAVPGLNEKELFSSGITFKTPVDPENKIIPFSLVMNLSGSESISFTPFGKKTAVNLQSEWTAPGFSGNFLPVERQINESGFTATWLITNLNRNFPQSWIGNSYNPENESFGTDFVLEADHYQKSLRSAKYGILFITLTFLALILLEFNSRNRIHFFHYLLFALALVLFFSLLNALSEQTGFNFAYLISASATVMLVSLFLKSIISSNKSVLLLTGLLIFLYSFIFVLLTLKDYAYLAGNVGLFIILAVTMKLSLKLRDA